MILSFIHFIHFEWLFEPRWLLYLDVVDVVRIVADDTREANLPQLRQLFNGEGGGPPAVLVPEPVPEPEVPELAAHDAGKGGPHHGTCG